MHIPPLNSMNLRHKFFLWSGLILVLFSLLLALFYYHHMKSILIQEALDKSEVILQEVEAIREYVKEELRPTIQKLHKDDDFILEAMSTTYVSLRIMKRFGRRMHGYLFRRVSLNPLNPKNMADPFEEEMFDWFEEHPDKRLWRGIIQKNGKSFFVSMEPDYFEPACLRCHGDYHDAPKELIKRYGTTGGFRFKEGDLGGIDSVMIPVSASLARITRDSILVFWVIFGSAMLVLFFLNMMFGKLVMARLGKVSSSLLQENGSSDETKSGKALGRTGADELDILRLSLKTLTRYVTIARKGAGLQPDFIGPYVVGPPVAPGTLSWLYQGTDTRTDQEVMLKLGFDNVFVNPLYAACLRAELKILQSVRHKNLALPLARENDIMIFERIHGVDLQQWIEDQQVDSINLLPIFSQLCDLLATLHWAGVVHHDLRPGVFLMTGDNTLKLFDMGHAFQRDIPDVILSSGLGPQGDPRYMAPELIQGKRGDSRSDIYSLGILIYLFATGKLPFEKQIVSLSGWLGIKKSVPAPGSINSDISQELENVILKAMAWDIEDRYQWVEDLWEDLQKAKSRDSNDPK